MRTRRSIVFYAWLGLAVQAALAAGVVVFVLAGAAYQRSAVLLLNQRVRRMQLANLTLRGDFLNTQRAVRAFQATGQARFAQTFFAGQAAFVTELMTLRDLAWPGIVGDIAAEAQAARAAFLSSGQAAAARGTPAAAKLYDEAAASTDMFVARNQRLQSLLSSESAALAAKAQRTLGIGMAATSAILAVGLMIPVFGFGLALRWTSAPLHVVTTTVRRQALGDRHTRAAVAGPADVQELARSVNFLADESERLRSVREASTRIYEHMHAPAIVSEAMAAIKDNLGVDIAWVGIVEGDELISLDGEAAAEAGSPERARAQASSLAWIRDLFTQRSSYCQRDLRSGIPAALPPQVSEIVRNSSAVSLLLTPFGVGKELMGVLGLLRNDAQRPWIGPEIEAVESLARDIGRALDHARLYAAKERLVAELQSLDRAKTGFLASASHDLRTPLTSIIGYIEMLRDTEAGQVTDEQATMLEAVAHNGRRLQNLIEDMLTISRIQLGVFTSKLRPVDLAKLIPGSVNMVLPPAQEAGITLDVRAPEEGLLVDGDAEQLDRVLMNLLTNAVKYTPKGGRVTLTASADDDDAVLVVKDTGIGIPDEEQRSLFTPFFRASNAVTRAIQGSGIGLSIVHTIVGHHRGKLALESAENVGTTVTVRIPLLHAGTPAQVSRAERAVH